MHNTVNNFDERYFRASPSKNRYYYSCKDCGEVVSDRYLHDKDHRARDQNPIVVFIKMSEIVTILWGMDGY